MVKRIVAAVLGGLVLFFWGYFSHAVLPIGEAGLRTTASEDVLLGAMKGGLSEPGVYILPGGEHDADLNSEAYKAWAAKYEAGPTAFLVYHPTGEEPMSLRQLGSELLTNMIAAMLAVFVLSGLSTGYVGRVMACTALGLLAWVSVSLSHWIWHRFPTEFALGEGVDQVGGWFLAGLLLAALIRPGGKR